MDLHSLPFFSIWFWLYQTFCPTTILTSSLVRMEHDTLNVPQDMNAIFYSPNWEGPVALKISLSLKNWQWMKMKINSANLDYQYVHYYLFSLAECNVILSFSEEWVHFEWKDEYINENVMHWKGPLWIWILMYEKIIFSPLLILVFAIKIWILDLLSYYVLASEEKNGQK